MKSILCVLLFAALPVFANQPVYRSLQETRSLIQIPEYTFEQKKLVLDQARLILEQLYVHQRIKTADFGPTANPIPYLNQLESELTNISTIEFHQRLSAIFYRLRDLHTLYYLPSPYACYQSFLPFALKEVKDQNGKEVIAVSEVGDDPDVVKYFPANFNVKVGDILTKYDGLDVEQAISRQMTRSLGANPSAARRNAILGLKFLQHNLDFLPQKDSIPVELMNNLGVKYQVNAPWITWTDWDCLAEAQIPEYLAAPVLRKKKFKPKIKIHRSKTKGESIAKINVGHTDEPELYWQINHSKYGTFGYIELASFTPDVLTVDEVIARVKEILLQDEMKKTDGLMIELRGNGGGQLPLAERLIQFFSPKSVAPTEFYLKNSSANSYYLNTLFKDDPFTVVLNKAVTMGWSFTGTHPITSNEVMNDEGQIYFKPIAVFTSSACYSACEVFSSLIQDNKLGTIFGEDVTTGGGGANTYSLNELLGDFGDSVSTGPFKKLPNNQNISFAWREGVRGGINKGRHIEDAGVKSDRLSPPAMSDLFNRTNDQLLVLQSFLKDESPKYTSNIYLENEYRQDFEIGSIPSFTASWNDTNTFVFKKNNKVVEIRNMSSSANDLALAYPATVSTNKIGQGRFEVQGLKDNSPVWRKVLNYRIIPKSRVLSLNQSWELNLNQPGDISTYTVSTPAKDGWHVADNSLHLGDGTAYGNDANVEASIFVTPLSDNYQLDFDAVIDTESSDILQVLAIVDGQTTVLIDKLSGNIPLTHYKADLRPFANKPVEIRFSFKSDPAVTLKGISITHLMLTPQ